MEASVGAIWKGFFCRKCRVFLYFAFPVPNYFPNWLSVHVPNCLFQTAAGPLLAAHIWIRSARNSPISRNGPNYGWRIQPHTNCIHQEGPVSGPLVLAGLNGLPTEASSQATERPPEGSPTETNRKLGIDLGYNSPHTARSRRSSNTIASTTAKKKTRMHTLLIPGLQRPDQPRFHAEPSTHLASNAPLGFPHCPLFRNWALCARVYSGT